MIDFRRAPLLLEAVGEPLALLPPWQPEPRAQLAFSFGRVVLVLGDFIPKARRSLAERFVEWLGEDPSTIEPDVRYRLVEEFRAECKRRRPVPRGQLYLRGKVAKPRSMGKRPTRAERREWAEVPVRLPVLPRSWGECQRPGGLPCPRYSCTMHLKYDINPDTGALKDLYPGREWYEMPDTCALEVAARGPHTLKETGASLSIVMEHARETLDEAIDEAACKMENTETGELGVDRDTAIARLSLLGNISRGDVSFALMSGREETDGDDDGDDVHD